MTNSTTHYAVEPSRHKAVRQYMAVINKVSAVFALAGIAALFGVVIAVVGDIIWRRVAGQSFIGLVDLTQLFVMAAASASIPLAFSRSTHVTVDLLLKFFPAALNRLLTVIAELLSLALMVFLFYLTWGKAMELLAYGDVSQNLAIPKIGYWGLLLAGLFLSILICAGKLACVLTGVTSTNNRGNHHEH